MYFYWFIIVMVDMVKQEAADLQQIPTGTLSLTFYYTSGYISVILLELLS